MDQVDSSSCEFFFPVVVKCRLEYQCNWYGNQFVDRFRQKNKSVKNGGLVICLGD